MPADPSDDEQGGRLSRFVREGWARWVVLAAAVAVVVVVVAALVNPAVAPSSDRAEPSPSPTDQSESSPSESSASPSSPPASSTSPEPSDDPPSADAAAPENSIPFDDVGEVRQGLTVSVSNLEAVDGEAQGAGEVAGPSVRVTLEVSNATADQIDLSTAVVNMYYGGEQSPALQLSGPGAVSLPPELAGNSTATVVVVFSVPAEERNLVTVEFDYSVNDPTIVFSGAGPQ